MYSGILWRLFQAINDPPDLQESFVTFSDRGLNYHGQKSLSSLKLFKKHRKPLDKREESTTRNIKEMYKIV